MILFSYSDPVSPGKRMILPSVGILDAIHFPACVSFIIGDVLTISSLGRERNDTELYSF